MIIMYINTNSKMKKRQTRSSNDVVIYVGPILNHGDNLGVSGSAFVYLLASCYKSDLFLFVPLENATESSPHINYGKNVQIKSSYDAQALGSLLSTFRNISKLKPKLVVMNFFPMSLGSSRLKNLVWSFLPVYLSLKGIRILVIFHNSVTTSDWKSLGYNSIKDKVSAFIYQNIEKVIFKFTKSAFLLKYYSEIVNKRTNLKVSSAQFKFIDSITATLASGNEGLEFITLKKDRPVKTIHIHGNFGPQKNVEFALKVLSNIEKAGIKFKLIISGSINPHFKGFKEKFDLLLQKYNSIISDIIIPIPESEIFEVFGMTDILLLPYRAAGGRSGVMDLGGFFGLDVIVFNQKEFIEQAKWYDNVHLIEPEELFDTLLTLLKKNGGQRIIDIANKFNDSKRVMQSLLNQFVDL